MNATQSTNNNEAGPSHRELWTARWDKIRADKAAAGDSSVAGVTEVCLENGQRREL